MDQNEITDSEDADSDNDANDKFFFLTGGTNAKNSDTDMNPYYFDTNNEGIPDLVEAGRIDVNEEGLRDIVTNIVDDIIAMALAYETANTNPGKYNSDDLDNQPGVSGYNPDVTSNCHGVDFEINVYPNPVGLTTDELTLELRANDQIHYIFITDALGKIWYENEIDQFQQILKIDTGLLPTGNYNILIENDGSFSAKRFVKIK